jgi:hypothetical protein
MAWRQTPIARDAKSSNFDNLSDCFINLVMMARIPAAIKSRIDRKKSTSELLKAYLATTKPELQIMTKIPGA